MSSVKNKLNYRNDIDGLRAFAVIFVLLFHVEFSLFQGGFIGVDIFFVISGFLITKLLYTEYCTQGKINYRAFYYRRLRRLFPALLVTLLFTYIGILFFLKIPHNIYAIESNIYSLFGASNIFFWLDSGYFDNSKYLKPLLHTWSLGVEEQFYLLWPLFVGLVLFKYNSKKIIFTIALISVVSFALNGLFFNASFLAMFSDTDLSLFSRERIMSAAFYMMPLRVFEFALGAILVFIPFHSFLEKFKVLKEILFILGLGIVFWFVFNLHATDVFPYYNALFVSLGTLLLIISYNSLVSKVILENKIAIYIGKVSYSLYLVHWPIIVFWYSQQEEKFSFIDKSLILVISFLLAVALHHFIENKFRYEKYKNTDNINYLRKRFVILSILLLCLFSALSLYGVKSKGHSNIFNHNSEQLNRIVADEPVMAKEALSKIRSLLTNDLFEENQKRKVLIIGDSMANDLNLALNSYAPISSQVQTRTLNIGHKCQFMITDRTKISYYDKQDSSLVKVCEDTIEKHFKSSLLQQADVVIITHNWYGFMSDEGVEKAINRIKSIKDLPIYVIAKRIHMTKGVNESIAQLLYKYKNPYDFNTFLFNKHGFDKKIDKRMKQITKNTGVEYLDIREIQCSIKEEKCFGISEEHELLYRDSLHWTISGATFFAKRMIEDHKFKEAILGQ